MELTLTVPMLKLFFALSKPKNRLKLKQAEPKELYQPLLNVKYGQDKQQVFDMYHAPQNVKQNIFIRRQCRGTFSFVCGRRDESG